MGQVQFGRILLLSHAPKPSDLAREIEWRPIERLSSRSDYSRFMLHRLSDYVETSHALCVQWDGFVVNGHSWDPNFLDYDYIGAVWPQFADRHNVGNGGFSLRSQRLLSACRDLPFDDDLPEDIVISRIHRAGLEKQGIRFAPEAIARRFAYERTASNGSEFGFHGAFNLVRYLRPRDAVRLFKILEPEVLAQSEHLELIRWALGRGRLLLASTMLSRLRRSRAAR